MVFQLLSGHCPEHGTFASPDMKTSLKKQKLMVVRVRNVDEVYDKFAHFPECTQHYCRSKTE